jgi:hypothetical protein
MEMVEIPLSAIQSSIEYFESEAKSYREFGNLEMAYWCEGRLSAYKSLLEVWHTVTV